MQVLPTRKQSGFDSMHGEHPEDLVAGDVRAMEQPGLASMHTLFLSEHNRTAKLIKGRQSNLSDEEIFQTARQIVGAEIQNIVYNEFLPVVLGNETYIYQQTIKTPQIMILLKIQAYSMSLQQWLLDLDTH